MKARTYNGRFLRHRFSPKPKVIATPNSLPKRIHVAKEAVSAAWQTKTRHRSDRRGKPNESPKTKPRPCVKNMLCAPLRYGEIPISRKVCPAQITDEPTILDDVAFVAGRTQAKHNTRRKIIGSINVLIALRKSHVVCRYARDRVTNAPMPSEINPPTLAMPRCLRNIMNAWPPEPVVGPKTPDDVNARRSSMM